MLVKRMIFVGAGLFLSGVLFYVLYSYSFLEITVSNSKPGDVSYSLTRQEDQDPNQFISSESSVKRLVKRGSYELKVQQNETSYLSVLAVGGFFGTTATTAPLVVENQRQFVGDNPSPCTAYIAGQLISFGCGSSFTDINKHVPATATTPTYIMPNQSAIEGIVEDTISLNGATFVLIKAPDLSEDQGAPHTLYRMDENMQLSDPAVLNLDAAKFYLLDNYDEGFIVYNTDFESVLYYSTPAAAPIELLTGEAVSGLQPYELSARETALVLAYSNNTEGETADIEDGNSEDVATSFVVYRTGSVGATLNLKGQYSGVEICGKDRLCALKGSTVEVYDISGSAAKRLYVIQDVDEMQLSANGALLIVRPDGVLNFDAISKIGYLSYSFGKYTSCGIQSAGSGYLVCLISPESSKASLYVDQGQPNTDNIDKKVLELLDTEQISDVSIYKGFIYISPNAGELVFDPSRNIYDYSPSAVAAANAAILQKVEDLQIDRSNYSISTSIN